MNFKATVVAAVRDFRINGYDSASRLERWTKKLREAIERELGDPAQQRARLEKTLRAIYRRLVDDGAAARAVPVSIGPTRFTLAKVAPRLRAELDRRIEASAQLIRDNRAESVEKTMRRFSGWATSQPPGGSAKPEAREAAVTVKKALTSLPYAERRVLIDQGHKLTANINAVVAEGSGAIAARWFSHFRQAGYNYREDHRERDGRIYLLRGSWAHEKGFVKPGKYGYVDDVTAPGEEVNCRCKYEYIYAVGRLPDDMVTLKGRQELERVRSLMASS